MLAEELAERIQALLEDNRFVDAVADHMPHDETSQARALIILKILKDMAEHK